MATPVNPLFSTAESSFLAKLLSLVTEQLTHKSSTEFALAPSAANKALAAACIEQAGRAGEWGDDAPDWLAYIAYMLESDDDVVTFMDWMSAYLATRCQALAAGSGAPLNVAELAVTAELLEVARDEHDEAAALDLVPHAIDVDDANRAILVQIWNPDFRPPGQENRVPMTMILAHFAQRCLDAS